MPSVGTLKYGMPAPGVGPATPRQAPGASNGAVTTGTALTAMESPVVWLLVIAAATMGLVGVSTTARIGPFHASASAGKS